MPHLPWDRGDSPHAERSGSNSLLDSGRSVEPGPLAAISFRRRISPSLPRPRSVAPSLERSERWKSSPKRWIEQPGSLGRPASGDAYAATPGRTGAFGTTRLSASAAGRGKYTDGNPFLTGESPHAWNLRAACRRPGGVECDVSAGNGAAEHWRGRRPEFTRREFRHDRRQGSARPQLANRRPLDRFTPCGSEWGGDRKEFAGAQTRERKQPYVSAGNGASSRRGGR